MSTEREPDRYRRRSVWAQPAGAFDSANAAPPAGMTPPYHAAHLSPSPGGFGLAPVAELLNEDRPAATTPVAGADERKWRAAAVGADDCWRHGEAGAAAENDWYCSDPRPRGGAKRAHARRDHSVTLRPAERKPDRVA